PPVPQSAAALRSPRTHLPRARRQSSAAQYDVPPSLSPSANPLAKRIIARYFCKALAFAGDDGRGWGGVIAPSPRFAHVGHFLAERGREIDEVVLLLD